jgi:hypothetical protein
MKKLLIISSFSLIVIGIIVSVYFFNSLSNEYNYNGQGEILMPETGQVGDFIGGIVGTLFALAGTFLIYLSFREQTNQNKREAFEAAFFEMLRLHRENVAELKYSKNVRNEIETSENRKVFRVIYSEFFECFREVNKFYRFTYDFLTPEYEIKLTTIKARINPQINLKEIAMVDIAYSIVFFGVGEDGEQILRTRFKGKYKEPHIFHLIRYLKLKPKSIDDFRFTNWQYLKELNVADLRTRIAEIYDYNRNSLPHPVIFSLAELNVLSDNDFIKYYGGHQFRLGHYYRHLFQTYKYLHFHKNLTVDEKYFYAKTLRAQLSTYEQALLFINSISSLGFKWELTPDFNNKKSLKDDKLNKELEKRHLISIYNLIKNLPGEKSFGLKYKTYYPTVKYESEE